MSQESRPKPFAPHGAVDGIVCDTTMAKNMSFSARFGNSCGIPFDAAKFVKEHRQYEKFGPYLHNRPSQEWTDFASEKSKGGFKLTKKGRNNNNRTKKNKK
jgi:hypothetical protein